MSRCFPYPPPGYVRNGGASHEALIESIKLQKETEKAKADRKKEKRAKKEKKEKKEKDKEKRKNDEKVKLQKTQNQDSHKLQKVAGFTEAQVKETKTNTEVLERSDLTEEHGQPIKPSYSSDCTQNSNKRRREDDVDDDDGLLRDDSPSHGKPFKIRLYKKQKGSDLSNSVEDSRLKTAPLKTAPSKAVSSNRNNTVQYEGIPLTETKSNPSLERAKNINPNGPSASCSSAKPTLPFGPRKSDIEALKTSRQQQQIASFVRPVVGPSASKPTLPSGPRKNDVEALKTSRQQQQIASFLRPVVGQSQLQHEIPSSSGRQQQGPSNLKPGIPDPVLKKPNPSALGKRPISEITVPVKPEKKRDVGPSRSEKKMMKKQAKYEKLIGSWVPPPVLQALLPGVDEDEDWLSRRTKTANTSICRGEVASGCELDATSLWQPRARFLAEADIHALPYTVPF